MFALGISPEAARDKRLGPIFHGQKFVQYLLTKGHLRETPAEGAPIGIYFRDAIPEHAGKKVRQRAVTVGTRATLIFFAARRHDYWLDYRNHRCQASQFAQAG
jgi:hypothetical protein